MYQIITSALCSLKKVKKYFLLNLMDKIVFQLRNDITIYALMNLQSFGIVQFYYILVVRIVSEMD